MRIGTRLLVAGVSAAAALTLAAGTASAATTTAAAPSTVAAHENYIQPEATNPTPGYGAAAAYESFNGD